MQPETLALSMLPSKRNPTNVTTIMLLEKHFQNYRTRELSLNPMKF